MAKHRVDIKKLKEWLPIYQDILRLKDWDFKIEISKELSGAAANNSMLTHGKYKVGTIRVSREFPDEDPEECLVHELIHSSMIGFTQEMESASDSDPLRHALLETFIDQMAKSIVRLKRDVDAAGE